MSPLRFPAGDLPNGARDFLDRHWQSRPLWMPGAAGPGFEGPGFESDQPLPRIEPDELAWLATLEDVESRLVTTSLRNGRTTYEMTCGPFDADRLSALPETGWTLLIQDVDKHLPAFRRYFALVPFVPDWRIDDLMLSVAAPGGSVGPHVDNYDVFLVQTEGTRRWRWTAEKVAPDAAASRQLELVEPFEAQQTVIAGPGDVLYLNPGVAHFGTATSLCVTASIGMRAPSLADLGSHGCGHDEVFYTDPADAPVVAAAGYIPPSALTRVAALFAEYGLDGDGAETALGRFVTANKPGLKPEAPPEDAPPADPLAVHGMARLAYTDSRVYANGAEYPLLPGHVRLMPELCATRALSRQERRRWRPAGDLLIWLWRQGVFDAPDSTAEPAN
ncbi:MAG: cupin domain-containing protein [Pseudomonadota bacterium]